MNVAHAVPSPASVVVKSDFSGKKRYVKLTSKRCGPVTFNQNAQRGINSIRSVKIFSFRSGEEKDRCGNKQTS